MRQDVWLSERLGRLAFTVEGEDPASIAAHAHGHSPALYHASVDAERIAEVAGLVDIGFSVVDVNLTLARAPAYERADESARVSIHDALEAHRPSLMALMDRDFRASRFYLDPAIPDELAARIMRDWLQSYFERTRGERLLVATENGEVAGFVAILADSDEGTKRIDLIAVRREAQGTGLGRALVGQVLANASGACERVDVGTQVSNLPALGFYARMGFTPRQARYVLHMHVGGAVS